MGIDAPVEGCPVAVAREVHELVAIEREDDSLKLSPSGEDPRAMAITGTTRSLINNMVTGVTAGFERKLELVGIGYRAQVKGNTLNLALGYSHPIDFPVPDGVSIDGLLPKFPLERAMAGGLDITYHDKIRAGDELVATRTLTDIYEKEGRSGPLIFYEVVLEVARADGTPVVTEKTTRLLR